MKILRRDRSGDLKQANSPYKIERAAYWFWWWLRHPVSMTFGRQVTVGIKLTDDAWVEPMFVYGNFEEPAYSAIQFQGAWIEGDARSLRRLAALLIDRAERVEHVQALFDAGIWPSYDDMSGFPDGFGPEVESQNLRLGNAKRAEHWTGA